MRKKGDASPLTKGANVTIRIDGAPPRYRDGWDDIVRLIANRDANIADPAKGPIDGYGRFMWTRSMWGWDDDLWMQKARVHDLSEAWLEDGVLTARCSCGLEIDFLGATFYNDETTDESDDSDGGRQGFHNFHATYSGTRSTALEIAFYNAPGHRDSFHRTNQHTFVALRTGTDSCEADVDWHYHLWCTHCGDLGLCSGAVTPDLDINSDAIERAIVFHESNCAGTSR